MMKRAALVGKICADKRLVEECNSLQQAPLIVCSEHDLRIYLFNNFAHINTTAVLYSLEGPIGYTSFLQEVGASLPSFEGSKKYSSTLRASLPSFEGSKKYASTLHCYAIRHFEMFVLGNVSILLN